MLVNLMPYLLGDEDRLLTVFSFSLLLTRRANATIRFSSKWSCSTTPRSTISSSAISSSTASPTNSPAITAITSTDSTTNGSTTVSNSWRQALFPAKCSLFSSFSLAGSFYWTAGFDRWIFTRKATPRPNTRPTSRSIPTGATADGPSSPTRPPCSPSSRFPRFLPSIVGLPAGIVVRLVESAESRAAAVLAVRSASLVASVLRPFVYSGRDSRESASCERANGICTSEIGRDSVLAHLGDSNESRYGLRLLYFGVACVDPHDFPHEFGQNAALAGKRGIAQR